jgi:hypothetical protein
MADMNMVDALKASQMGGQGMPGGGGQQQPQGDQQQLLAQVLQGLKQLAESNPDKMQPIKQIGAQLLQIMGVGGGAQPQAGPQQGAAEAPDQSQMA